MPRLFLSFRSWWHWLLLCFCCVPVLAQTPATIVLREVAGTVTVNRADGSSVPGVNELALVASDRVITGADGAGVLVFSNGVRIALRPTTEILVERFTRRPAPPPPPGVMEQGSSDTRIRLTSGQIVGQVDKLRPDSKFEVVTPVGVAGIRGTQFVITLQRNGDGTLSALIGVKQGLVEFRLEGATADAAATLLGANQQVQISADVNEATGEVTIDTGAQTLQVTPLDPAVLRDINAAVTVISQAISQILTGGQEIIPIQRGDADPTNGAGQANP